MYRSKKFVAVVGCVVLAACSSGASDATSSTAPTTAAAGEPTTTSTVAETTTTTIAATTTTGAAPQATGDLSVIQAAMAKSAESAPSRIEGVISMVGVDPGDGVPVDIEMPFSVQTDAATGNTAMVMDFGAMAGAMGSTGEMPAEVAELMGSMEVRQIGDTVYLKFPLITAFMGAQTEWVSMPAEEGAGLAGSMGAGAAPSDPTSFLGSLSDAEGTVEELGSEDVRGFSTTRYRVVVDDSWREQLTAEELADLEAQGPLPETSFPMDLWIDGDGLVHRMAMDVTSEDVPESEDEFESMTMTFDFFDFGQTVTIEPPPADQVTDVSEVAGPFGTTAP